MSPMAKDKSDSHRSEQEWDVRHIERHLKRGTLSRKDYEKHLKTLPDVKDKAGRLPER